jgi:hypothetical protein
MNSFINLLLEQRGLIQHDGRPLWKYNLSDEEYDELKAHLSQIDTNDFDPQDITLFYAEWWKNEYHGGLPTKMDVYNSLKSCNLYFDDFYKFAKRGAVLFGIKWIQRENRLYFRTLLMQGGLPINHMLNNSGVYTRFLKKVLEINPSNIEEFMYEDDIIGILPFATRNEAVYESCLQISKAIWSGDQEYLEIFENKRTTTTSFKKITDELKKHKEEVEKIIKKRTKFRAYWILKKTSEENTIKLHFNFPEIIDKNDFTDLTQIPELELKAEYNLIINELLVFKFKKNIKGNYKVFWFNNSNIYWDGEETKPDIYLSTMNGKRFDFPILMIDNPRITEPTLWTQKTEFEWILNQGKYCIKEQAACLFSEEWLALDKNYLPIEITQQNLKWVEFEGELELTKKEETIFFKTNNTSFEWFVKEDKPKWVVKSNIPIVTKLPQIVAYTKSGERIQSIELSWRLYGDIVWNKWNNSNLPSGCIEYKIKAVGCEERDYFYNIGTLYLCFVSESNNSTEAKILIEQNCNLELEIKKNELFETEFNNNEIVLKLFDFKKTPKTVSITLNKPNQKRSLHLEIIPPFYGIKILDQQGNILEGNSTLLFGNFIGYRIAAPFQQNYFFIKLYNTQKPKIKIIKNLNNSIIPLREYEELAMRLFRLTDTMNKNSSVSVELYDSNETLISTYFIKNHNKSLSYDYENEQVNIRLKEPETEIDLFAIPLDCSPSNIELISLNKGDDRFIFPFTIAEKFIIISEINNNKNNSKLLPCFISTNQDNQPTTIIDRKQRIKNHIANLKSQNANEYSWERLRKYYKICINHEIPFSTFDIFRAAASTPELATKLFCFLSIYNDDDNFIYKTCNELENDLGFCFHWISKCYWEKAVVWIIESFNLLETSEEIKLLKEMIYSLINSSEPIEWFNIIAEFTINNKINTNIDFHLNTEIQKLRQYLGEKVLNELPYDNNCTVELKECPTISDEFIGIFPVTKDNYLIKILLKVPIAVALSISGKDEFIWHDSEKDERIRRNIQYCQWIAPDWYGKSILYCLNQLENRKNH